MNKKELTAVLQVALWKQDGMSELEIRQHLAKLVSNKIVNAGIKLHAYLKALEVKQ